VILFRLLPQRIESGDEQSQLMQRIDVQRTSQMIVQREQDIHNIHSTVITAIRGIGGTSRRRSIACVQHRV